MSRRPCSPASTDRRGWPVGTSHLADQRCQREGQVQPKTVLTVGEVETRQGLDALQPVVEGLAVQGQLSGGALHVAGVVEVGGQVGPREEGLSLRRQRVRRHPRPRRPDQPVRADRGRLRDGPGRGRAGPPGPAARRGQLLRQRPAHRLDRLPPALRRQPGVGHERQGRLDAERPALDEPAGDQGDLRRPRRPYVPAPAFLSQLPGSDRPTDLSSQGRTEPDRCALSA